MFFVEAVGMIRQVFAETQADMQTFLLFDLLMEASGLLEQKILVLMNILRNTTKTDVGQNYIPLF